MTRRNVAEWYDCNQRYLETKWCQADGTAPDALIVALQNHSAAGLWKRVEGAQVAVNAAPSGTPYATRDVYALLTFCTAENVPVRLRIPAPNLDIFMGVDRDVVDATKIADVIEAALGNLSDTAGNPVTYYSGGVRAASGNGDF